jgi:hypothetical protein
VRRIPVWLYALIAAVAMLAYCQEFNKRLWEYPESIQTPEG